MLATNYVGFNFNTSLQCFQTFDEGCKSLYKITNKITRSLNIFLCNDLVHSSRCLSTNCTDGYIRETARCLSERIMDDTGRDTKSHIVRHCLNSNHGTVSIENFKIINMGYNNNTYKRRISEALFVKQYHPSLNVQDSSVPLQLFN